MTTNSSSQCQTAVHKSTKRISFECASPPTLKLRRTRLRPRSGFGRHATRSPQGEGWWSRTGSNRRPEACKATALPTELRPPCAEAPGGKPPRQRVASHPKPEGRRMVGLGRFELPTSRLSSARSNQLSYRPDKPLLMNRDLSNPERSQCGRDTWTASRTMPGKIGRAQVEAHRSWQPCFRKSKAPCMDCPRTPRERSSRTSLKGGDPAAGSPTATLLRLHPSR